MQYSKIALATILVMGSGHLLAEEMRAMNEEDLMLLYADEEMISIATGTSKPIHLAPSVASVITAKDIKAMGARTLDEALETVPGLHVSKSSNRNNSIYSFRGIRTDGNPQVLLLVNGMPFNDLITGSRPPLFRLPVENISRIEVIRGPGSAVFGADAFAGVINVITKDGNEIDGGIIGGRAGSFNTREGWAQYGGDMAGWNVGVSLEYSTSKGDRERIINADLQTDLDGIFGTSASLAPGPLETGYNLLNGSISLKQDQWSIWFNSWNLDNAGVGPGIAQALDPAGSQMVDQYTLKVDYSSDTLVEDWQLDSSFSYRIMDQQAAFQILPPGAVVPIGADGNLFTPPGCGLPPCLVAFPEGVWGNPGGQLTDTRLEVAGVYKGWHGQRLRLAAGIDRDGSKAVERKNFGPGVINGSEGSVDGSLTDVSGTANIFVQNRSRTVEYLSLQDEWQLARDWELTAGLRYDSYSDFGETSNPRLALVWATDYNLTSKLLYGRSFRAPSVKELFFENNPVTTGNPDLSPETIDMVELVFDYRPTFELQTILNLFVYHADDLIEFVNGAAQNNRQQNGRGLEFEAIWAPGKGTRIKGNVALQFSYNNNDGSIAKDAPRRQLFIAADQRLMDLWSLYGQANWVSGRARARSDSRPAINDYTTVDMALRYQSQQPWQVALSAKNIFDQDAREPSDGTIPGDYPLAGRAVYLELQYKLN